MDDLPGTYRNPVLHADYSDPDVIRVGSDFFLVSSSFQAAPGLPLLHSADLVNWTLVNHILPRLPWPDYALVAHGRGVWAPSLRYRNGEFLVYFGAPDEGLYLCRTTDPFGPWSAPVCVKKAVGWIDPCPFWDDDGSAYLVNAFANSRIGFKSVLRMNRLSPDGSQVLDEGRFIFDGQSHHITIEGPKLYKRNGFYYIFAPAGGVKHGWQTVLRSKSIWGPYEDRTVLHQGTSRINGPHQGAWVELESGESWFLHFQDKGPFGRVVHLQPMTWAFDWPRMGRDVNGDGIGEPVDSHPRPSTGTGAKPAVLQVGDRFEGPALDLAWQWQANPPEAAFSLNSRPGFLRLAALPRPAAAPSDLSNLPHLLAQKFPAEAFEVQTTLDLAGARAGDLAGLAVVGERSAALALRKTASGCELVFVEGAEIRMLRSWTNSPITLIVKVDPEGRCRFEPSDCTFTALPGRWVGAKVGLFCRAEGSSPSGGWADFGPFLVTG